MMLGGLLLFTKKDVVVYSKPVGKAAQFVTVAALVLCFFHRRFNVWGYPVHLWALWTGVGLSIAALLYYTRSNFCPQFGPGAGGKAK